MSDADLSGRSAIKRYRCHNKHRVEVQRREWLVCTFGFGGRKGQRLEQSGSVLERFSPFELNLPRWVFILQLGNIPGRGSEQSQRSMLRGLQFGWLEYSVPGEAKGETRNELRCRHLFLDSSTLDNATGTKFSLASFANWVTCKLLTMCTRTLPASSIAGVLF